MKTRSSKTMTILALIVILMSIHVSAFAQKIKDMEGVKYLQLPTLDAKYGSVDVYVKADQSGTRDALSFGFGKSAGGNSDAKKLMESFVKDVFADQVEKYGTWSLYEGNISEPENASTLRAVITYLPDDNARPMGTPMKNNKQEHVFSYRVKAHMRVYNDQDELLVERDFGTVTGRGHSKTWPQASGSSGFSLSVAEEDESAPVHPYETACIEGAIQQTYRVLYGMYGIKEFEMPLSAAIIDKQKESKEFYKKYTEVLENKASYILNRQESAIIKECVDYWESILGSTREKSLWAVHYNLAIGYAWLLNTEKSKEYIRSFHELKKDTFEKIINKSGSFNHKDIAVLEAYNMAQPFAEYYADGINQHMDWVKLLSLDLNSVSEVNAMNFLISEALQIPVVMPVFPANHQNMQMKKGTGTIYKADQKIMDFEYKVKKGKLAELKVKGVKNTISDGIKGSLSYTPQSSKETREKNHISHSFEGNSISGKFALNKEQLPYIHSLNMGFHNVWKPFQLDNAKISNVKHDTQRMASLRLQNDDLNLVQSSSFTGNTWYKCSFTINDSVNVTLNADHLETIVKPTALDDNGIPTKYQVTWNLENAYIGIHAKIKYKLLEETYTQQRRQDSADRKMRPIIRKMLLDNIVANGGTFTEKDKSKYDISITYEYDFSLKSDKKGNWTEIQIGDYRLQRELKY